MLLTDIGNVPISVFMLNKHSIKGRLLYIINIFLADRKKFLHFSVGRAIIFYIFM